MVLLHCGRGFLIVALGGLTATAAYGQIIHAVGPVPSFEVATIKPWKPKSAPVIEPTPAKTDPVHVTQAVQSDRVNFIGQIDLLIMSAYGLPVGSDKKILHGPQWVDSEADRYEVNAKIDSVSFAAMRKMSPERQQREVSLMEQSLLAERFKLKVHFELRGEISVFALVIAKGGPKLIPAGEGEEAGLSSRGNEITGRAVTIDQFAASPLWTPIGDRFVVNRTGLTGAYDFILKWRSDPIDGFTVSETSQDLPPLFDAIQEQLGLRVVELKAPQEVIIIDHIERPSPN